MHQGLDLSRFKKVSSDKKTTTLRHSKGHEIRIAHSALTPKMKEQLESLPQHDDKVARYKDGGEVTEDIDPSSPEEVEEDKTPDIGGELTGADEQAPSAIPENMELARAGAGQQTQSPEDVGPLGADTNATDENQEMLPDHGALANEEATSPEAALGKPELASYTPEQMAQDLKNDNEMYKNDVGTHITPETYHSLFAKKDTLGKIGTLFGMLIGGAGAGLSHQPSIIMDMMNREIQNDLEAQKANVGNKQSFIRLMQQHEMNQAQIRHLGAQQGLTEAETGAVPTKARLTGAQAELTEAEAKAMPTKMALTAAQTRDANIKAQAGANILANRAAFHDMITRIDKMPDGPAKQQALQGLALMAHSTDAENYNIADRAAANSALGHALNPEPGTAQDPESNFRVGVQSLKMNGMDKMADDLQARHMPGIKGQASVPLNDGDRQAIQGSQALMGSLARLKAFAKANPKPIKGSRADVEGKALAAQVQGDFRIATKGGVYKEGEQNFINQVVPGDPTTWNPFAHVTDKIDTVYNETKSRNDQFLQSKGFPDQSGSAKQGTKEGAIATNKKTGERMTYRGGKWVPEAQKASK